MDDPKTYGDPDNLAESRGIAYWVGGAVIAFLTVLILHVTHFI